MKIFALPPRRHRPAASLKQLAGELREATGIDNMPHAVGAIVRLTGDPQGRLAAEGLSVGDIGIVAGLDRPCPCKNPDCDEMLTQVLTRNARGQHGLVMSPHRWICAVAPSELDAGGRA